METVNELLSDLYKATLLPSNQQGDELTKLLSLEVHEHSYIVKINRIPQLDEHRLESMIEEMHFYKDEWLAFNEVVISYVKLCNLMDPWSLLNSFDLYLDYVNCLSTAFNNSERGHLMSYLIKNCIESIIPMAQKLDKQLYLKENCAQARLTFLAAIILKIFNNIRSQISGEVSDNLLKFQMKSSIILYMGVRLCEIYFKLSNPLLCRNIFSNINNANLTISKYSLNEQVQYRYYLGRFYIIKNQFLDAYEHLMWCLSVCPKVQNSRNLTCILKYLLPTSIVLGKIPNYNYLSRTYFTSQSIPQFMNIYMQISKSIKAGNYEEFKAFLCQTSVFSYLKRSNLLILVSTRFPILILRNLVRQAWVLSGRPTRLDYDKVLIALRLSFSKPHGFNSPPFISSDLNSSPASSESLTMFSLISNIEDPFLVENVLITLIDQNLLKGKLLPRLKMVSLAKSNVFPNVTEINYLRFGNGKEGILNSNESWLNK